MGFGTGDGSCFSPSSNGMVKAWRGPVVGAMVFPGRESGLLNNSSSDWWLDHERRGRGTAALVDGNCDISSFWNSFGG